MYLKIKNLIALMLFFMGLGTAFTLFSAEPIAKEQHTYQNWFDAPTTLKDAHLEFLMQPFTAFIKAYNEAKTLLILARNVKQGGAILSENLLKTKNIIDPLLMRLKTEAAKIEKLESEKEDQRIARLPIHDFYAFKERCKDLFNNKSTTIVAPETEFFPLLSACAREMQQHAPGTIAETDNIIVQKYEFKKDDTLAIHADIHGDAQSLLAYLLVLAERKYLDKDNPFKIAKAHKDNFYMAFLGDYAGHGRGRYANEVYALLCCLYLINPGHVFLLKGNHEEFAWFIHDSLDPLCFTKSNYYKQGEKDEITRKEDNLNANIKNFMSFLTSALMVGTNHEKVKDFMICCHAGVEYFGTPDDIFKVRRLLDSTEPQGTSIVKRTLDYKNPIALYVKSFCADIQLEYLKTVSGFLWTDFSVQEDAQNWIYFGRGLNANKELTELSLNMFSAHDSLYKHTLKTHGYLRGHQHSSDNRSGTLMSLMENLENTLPETDKGIAKLWLSDAQTQGKIDNGMPRAGALWDGIVCTFLVSPDAGYPDVKWDTAGLLHFNDLPFETWTLEVIQIPTEKINSLTLQ